MIQQVKAHLTGTMPVVWPTLLDLGRDECKRILRKLELEAYAGVISALRAQGDLTKDKKDLLGELTKVLSISTERHRAEVRRAVNDERLTTIAYHMSGPNSSSEWSIEGRRLVPLMPRLVPQTAFTVTANSVASATANQNASLLLPAETGNKEVVVCYSYTTTTSTPTSATAPSGSATATVKSPRPASPASNVVVLPSGSTVYVKSVSCSDEDEKPRKRRRTNSSSSSPVVLKELAKVAPPLSKTITVPVSGSPKMSNIMQSIANSLPPHMSPVKITFTKPTTQTTNTTTQKVIIVTTSPSSNFVPNILSKSHSHNYAAAMSKLVSTSMLTSASQKQTVFIPASSSPSLAPNTIAVTTVVSSSPSVLMSTIAQSGSSAGVKVASARLPSPKTMVSSPTQILSQFPKQHPQSPKQLQQGSPMGAGAMGQVSNTPPSSKPIIQIKQESGVKIITQQMQPSKILPKPPSAGMPSSSSSPIMVVSSNGAIMTTKLVSQPTGASYSRPAMSSTIGARMATSASGATYVKTTSGSIITVVPKTLATLGGKIISSNIVSGTTTKITTIPMTSKPNVIVVQKTTGKGTTIQGLPGKNVVTTLLNTGGEKTLQGVPGSKPAIITASRPITKMIVTQPKGMGSGVQPTTTTTKIIPTKIVYGQQGKTQVLIKPKPIFQTAVVSEQTRQLVNENLQQASRVADVGPAYAQERALKDESGAISEGRSPPAEDSHGSVKEKGEAKPRQQTIDLSQMAVPLQMAQEKKQQALGSPEMSTVETEPPIKYITASAGQLMHSKQVEETGMEEGELEGDTLDPQTGLFYRSIQPAVAQPPAPLKERPSSASGSPQLASLGTPNKPPSLTPQLPKLQQAPTSHHRPIHTQLSQPPPLQAHHPVGADKTPATSQAPIITQGASVTKITFGSSSSHQSPPVSSSGEATAKLVPAEPSSSSSSSGEKPSVSDILKISMMEAEIDPSAEPMVVDSSSDCSPYIKALGMGAGGGSGALGGSAKRKENMDVIEVIPQYSIMPDSSQSNVVVEPSGFLEITDYTSQRLDEESAMEQEVDSSNDEATAISPMEEGCPDQSQ
uniref:BRCA2-interacting transcriptional repressor EMSY n=1 Tax=Oncorhynchus tshawytscha TaxID=74940 RepID=A0A8C8HMW5_ONCTS